MTTNTHTHEGEKEMHGQDSYFHAAFAWLAALAASIASWIGLS